MTLFFIIVVIKFCQVMTASVTLSGHPTLFKEIPTPPLYWSLIKTPGIGHRIKDYDYAEKNYQSLQINGENLPLLQYPVPSYNLKPTTNFHDETVKNEKLKQLSSKMHSIFGNPSNNDHFIPLEVNKNLPKFNSSQPYFALMWFPSSDSIDIVFSSQTSNNSSYSTDAKGDFDLKNPVRTIGDGRVPSEALNVQGQKRSPRIYSEGRGLSSHLSVDYSDVLPMFIFDVPQKCPPRHQLDSQGKCRPIFTFNESDYKQGSMYSSPAKPSLLSKQNNTIPNNWGTNGEMYSTNSTIANNGEMILEKPLDEVRPTDVVVIGLNNSADLLEELLYGYQEPVTRQSIKTPLINGSVSQNNMSTNSDQNVKIGIQMNFSMEPSGMTTESFSNFIDSEVTASDDFFFGNKTNDNNFSLWSQEVNSTDIYQFLNASDLSNKEKRTT